jgi:hypothetical protein
VWISSCPEVISFVDWGGPVLLTVVGLTCMPIILLLLVVPLWSDFITDFHEMGVCHDKSISLELNAVVALILVFDCLIYFKVVGTDMLEAESLNS